MWSFSLVITKRVGVTTNANFLAEYLEQDENTLRQRLREWYWDAEQKRGAKRQELDVARVFPDLLQWVLRLWPPDSKQLVLTMDVTTHKDIFAVLSIHAVYRCCAIPIGWKILPGNQPGAWKPHWQALFELLKGLYLRTGVSSSWQTVVSMRHGYFKPSKKSAGILSYASMWMGNSELGRATGKTCKPFSPRLENVLRK